MKGFVQTPASTVELMVGKLFEGKRPTRQSRLLDPGCGQGAFIEGIIRWCQRANTALPEIVGIESDLRHLSVARAKFRRYPSIKIFGEDFLDTPQIGRFDFVIGNPPYVPITELTEHEKSRYRTRFEVARGRFDLYLLFFEQALRHLDERGCLVYITPEKYLYTGTASPLRRILSQFAVIEVALQPEDTFQGLVTYPALTTVKRDAPSELTRIVLRDLTIRRVKFPDSGASWWPTVHGLDGDMQHDHVLGDVCRRVSCGVATGSDGVFVLRTSAILPGLQTFAHPTIAGRDLLPGAPELPATRHSMLIPYTNDGSLIPESQLGPLRHYLSQRSVREQLLRRTCVRHKCWYAFHENPPMGEILRPKILCKDITPTSHFWIEPQGDIVPRHSVYYIVPEQPEQLVPLCNHLNGEVTQAWLVAHCQRAANGFLRLQSEILKQLPIPPELAGKAVKSNRRRLEVA